jgi:hypothetical protein
VNKSLKRTVSHELPAVEDQMLKEKSTLAAATGPNALFQECSRYFQRFPYPPAVASFRLIADYYCQLEAFRRVGISLIERFTLAVSIGYGNVPVDGLVESFEKIPHSIQHWTRVMIGKEGKYQLMNPETGEVFKDLQTGTPGLIQVSHYERDWDSKAAEKKACVSNAQAKIQSLLTKSKTESDAYRTGCEFGGLFLSEAKYVALASGDPTRKTLRALLSNWNNRLFEPLTNNHNRCQNGLAVLLERMRMALPPKPRQRQRLCFESREGVRDLVLVLYENSWKTVKAKLDAGAALALAPLLVNWALGEPAKFVDGKSRGARKARKLLEESDLAGVLNYDKLQHAYTVEVPPEAIDLVSIISQFGDYSQGEEWYQAAANELSRRSRRS